MFSPRNVERKLIAPLLLSCACLALGVVGCDNGPSGLVTLHLLYESPVVPTFDQMSQYQKEGLTGCAHNASYGDRWVHSEPFLGHARLESVGDRRYSATIKRVPVDRPLRLWFIDVNLCDVDSHRQPYATGGLSLNAKEVRSSGGDPPVFEFVVRSNGSVEQ